MTARILYPIITTSLVVLFFLWPSIKSIFKKPKKRTNDFTTAGGMSYAIGGLVDGFERSLEVIVALVLYGFSWLIWFIIFIVF